MAPRQIALQHVKNRSLFNYVQKLFKVYSIYSKLILWFCGLSHSLVKTFQLLFYLWLPKFEARSQFSLEVKRP